MWHPVKKVLLGSLLLVAVGCMPVQKSAVSNGLSVQNKSSTTISSLFKSNDCQRISRGGFMLLQDPVVLEDLLMPLGLAAAQATVAQVNFQTEDVLVVDFGAQPTKNVSIGLASDQLDIDGNRAIVKVNLPQRIQGKKQAQVVSHPCEFYVLPKTGHQGVEIRSQFNDCLLYTSPSPRDS